jgi:hypothetical protein
LTNVGDFVSSYLVVKIEEYERDVEDDELVVE